MLNFVKYPKIYIFLSLILVLISIFSLLFYGLELGIEFTGGSSLEISYRQGKPDISLLKKELTELGLEGFNLRPLGERGVILEIREKEVSPELEKKIVEKFKKAGEIENEESFHLRSISPVIGKELQEKAKVFIILSVLVILIYISLAFRRLQRPISSFGYALISIFALLHDIIIPLGVFAILGRFYNLQISIPIVVALLTVLGYSINNTVVVFDRIRENLLKRSSLSFKEVVNLSLNQVFSRSINTSLTTLFVLISLFFFGGETLKYFSLILILGIMAGTYSSLFLVSSLLINLGKTKLWRVRS